MAIRNRRGTVHANVAVGLVAAMGVLLAGCGTSPTVPQTSVVINSVSALTTSAIAQTMTVTGSGFQSGLTLSIVQRDDGVSTVNLGPISNVTSTSFQASLAITSGAFTFQVTNPLGPASAVFPVVVQLACASPAPLTGFYDPTAPGYIVQYVSGTNPDTTAAMLGAKYGFSPKSIYHVLSGFSALLTPVTVDGLRCGP